MKILLVSANRVQTPHPVYPLGLDYVRGALTPRHEVRIVDVNVTGALEPLAAALRAESPDVVGISLRNIDNVDALALKSFLPNYERLCHLVRESTGAPIVLGGCGFSIFPGELMALLDADYGVIGEGEYLPALLEAIERGEDAATLPGVIVRGGEVKLPLPWPGEVVRQLDPVDERLRYYLERGGILNLQTKRGCPFHCVYCSYPHIEGKEFRFFPPDRVAREAKTLEALGARYLFITDSAFNADEEHSLAVARAFHREGLRIPWGAFLTPRRPVSGYYETLAEAGMAHAEFGTESLCDAQLQRLGKPFRAEEVYDAHAAARKAGLHVAHYFLFGGPGEGPETVEETLAAMETLEKAVFFLFCGVRIFPHTPLYRIALAEGQIRQEQDLLSPVFYRPSWIEAEEIGERVKRQARGRSHWVYGDGGPQTERILTRMYARGHAGPLWEGLLR